MKTKDENEIIDFLVEVDSEKKVVYISEYNYKNNTKCISKRYRNKRDILRTINNYLYHCFLNQNSMKKK